MLTLKICVGVLSGTFKTRMLKLGIQMDNELLYCGIEMDGWMTCDFTSFLTAFQSYQDDVWMIMKGCVQWNSVYG